jgi:hypothetical protein
LSYSDMMMIRIQALEWVQGQIQDLVTENEDKGTKVMI